MRLRAVALRRLAERASVSERRLDGTIGDLLQFARSGAGAREGARADVDAALRELEDELRPVAERAGVALAVAPAPGLHACIAAVALETIVANLVENAVKYRRAGAEARVDVSAAVDGDRVVVAVRDNGIGIAPDLVPRLFDPFFRATKRPDSYGLGLATVKRLLEAHQGTIAVDSVVGEGSTFSVTLPRAEVSRGSPDRRAATPGGAR